MAFKNYDVTIERDVTKVTSEMTMAGIAKLESAKDVKRFNNLQEMLDFGFTVDEISGLTQAPRDIPTPPSGLPKVSGIMLPASCKNQNEVEAYKQYRANGKSANPNTSTENKSEKVAKLEKLLDIVTKFGDNEAIEIVKSMLPTPSAAKKLFGENPSGKYSMAYIMLRTGEGERFQRNISMAGAFKKDANAQIVMTQVEVNKILEKNPELKEYIDNEQKVCPARGLLLLRFAMDYITLMNKSDLYCNKAIEMYKKGEMELAKFFKNASIGFKMRALDLLV